MKAYNDVCTRVKSVQKTCTVDLGENLLEP